MISGAARFECARVQRFQNGDSSHSYSVHLLFTQAIFIFFLICTELVIQARVKDFA